MNISISHMIFDESLGYLFCFNFAGLNFSVLNLGLLLSSIYLFIDEKIASPLGVLSGCGIMAITFPALLQIAAILFIEPLGLVGNSFIVLPFSSQYLYSSCSFSTISFSRVSGMTNLPSP